ncbi:hypothetical protein, partial [Bacillus pumilus]|uniref:hypothetical protein n=1 Tax=Bacillus pumilus TaxID=1408 RepID=UPI001C930A53
MVWRGCGVWVEMLECLMSVSERLWWLCVSNEGEDVLLMMKEWKMIKEKKIKMWCFEVMNGEE